MKDGFIRQRRNLIGSSVALFFIETSKINFKKINILGNEFSVGDPNAINIGLWVALIYFLVRYYQYAHDLEECRLGTFYDKKLLEYVKPAALNKALKEKGIKKKTKSNDKITEYTVEGLGVFSAGPSWKIRMDFCKGETSGNGHSSSTSQLCEINLSKVEMLLPRIRAFIKTSIHTTYFTEYVLPFVIFLMPVIYKFKNVI